MPYAAALSLSADTDAAIDEVCESLQRDLAGSQPDLTLVFVSHHHRSSFADLAGELQSRLRTRILLGCGGEFIAGGSREIEGRPALSVWSAVMPGALLIPFHVTFEATPDGLMTSGWPEEFAEQSDLRAVLLLGEPHSTPVDAVIERLADELPNVPLVGGMASGGRGPGQNCVFFNSEKYVEGAVGVGIFGGPRVTSIVSQGCRPVGPNFVITKARDNIVVELGGKPAMVRLQEVYGGLPEHDQALLQAGPHLGLVMNELQGSFGHGDYLISNIMGGDPQSGAIAVGTLVRVGQTVRLHVRDATTAHEDLTALLTRHKNAAGSADRAALLFSCNGRGTRLFPEANHDAATIREELGNVPLAGFFAAGELGPVGNKNYIHGYTASVVCFADE